MKGKKLLSALIAGAMVLGTMSFPVFAVSEPIEPEAVIEATDVESETISLMSVEDSWIDNANTEWYNETDTEFTLTTPEQLAGLAQLVNVGNNFSGKTIKLGNDINLAGKNWTPIGGEAKAFNGVFDGDNKSIKNMLAKNSYDYGNGFFHSLIGPATVKNVSFNNAKVYRGYSYSGNVYGIVSGYAYGNVTFENIHVANSMVRGYGKVGAILGMAADPGDSTTSVTNCTVENVSVGGVYNCGTFIGLAQNNVDMSVSSYSDVSWSTSYSCTPIEDTAQNIPDEVNGLYIKFGEYYYAAWSDLYTYYGSFYGGTYTGIDVVLSDGRIADGFCANNYASIGNIQYSSLQDAIDAAEDGDTITLRRNYKNATVNANKNITFKTSKYIMPNVVTPDNKYLKKINTTTYSILDSESIVIDNAKTTGAEVTLDNLKGNAAVNHNEDATYKVVVNTAPEKDVEKANVAIEDNDEDTNNSKAIFDISVKKINSYGVETDLGGNEEHSITNQRVTITLGETPKADTVKVYHVNGDSVDSITNLTVNGKSISFTAPSFSTYAVTYDVDTTVPVEVTDSVNVLFSRVSENSNQFYITLKSAEEGKKINRFMSTDLAFINNCATVDYDITPSTNVNVTLQKETGNSREYHFEMDGNNASCATGEGITIGTITFEGYGTLDFSVDTGFTSEHSINIVNTAELANNIVDNYTVDGGTLLVNNDVRDNLVADESGTINGIELKVPTKDLNINIAYNNKINNQVSEYQDMKVTISGGDLAANKVVKLGTTPVTENTDATVDYDSVNSAYTINFADELTKNITYTVTVTGAGYRTARYTVLMNTDKTLNFWNNVKDNDEEIEVDKTTSKVKTNFLAGDIVKDNNINIYDLSAVVSYFGEDNLVTNHPDYAKYDLNRDGKIDSKDVAYVLVSWGN